MLLRFSFKHSKIFTNLKTHTILFWILCLSLSWKFFVYWFVAISWKNKMTKIFGLFDLHFILQFTRYLVSNLCFIILNISLNFHSDEGLFCYVCFVARLIFVVRIVHKLYSAICLLLVSCLFAFSQLFVYFLTKNR